jgi:hypothetical protein
MVIFRKSWTPTGYSSNLTSSSVTNKSGSSPVHCLKEHFDEEFAITAINTKKHAVGGDVLYIDFEWTRGIWAWGEWDLEELLFTYMSGSRRNVQIVVHQSESIDSHIPSLRGNKSAED